MPKIVDKRQMYAALARGDFGNTLPSWSCVREWEASEDFRKFDWWGVRTLSPGGPCRLHCPRGEVAETVRRFDQPVNISIMVDRIAAVGLWAEVCSSQEVYGIEYPERGASWRHDMPSKGRQWHGVAARSLLRKHLNPNDLDNLDRLFDEYPGHIVELSALDRCVGTVPHCGSIVWEVRFGGFAGETGGY